MIGAGLGIVLAGFASSLFGWRAAFVVLAVPGALLAWAVWAFLPEPARGGQSRIAIGDEEIRPQEQVQDEGDVAARKSAEERSDSLVVDVIERKGIRPQRSTVLSKDQDLSLWRAVIFTLRVRTNVILIVASSLGYFFFAGLQTFTIIFLREHFELGQGTATLLVIVVGVAVVVGLLVAGNLGDKLIRRGRVNGRILIGAFGFLMAAAFLAPGIISTSVALSLPLFVFAGVAVSAPNPGLDAARLDVMPARVWGRAEAVRTVLRQSLVAFAPLVFGVVSEALGGAASGIGAGTDPNHSHLTAAQGQSLELTFLLMLLPLIIGGLILLRARSSYVSDVASALESDRQYREHPTVAGQALNR